MTINRKFFFDYIRNSLFDGKLNQSQANGLTLILDAWEPAMSNRDDRWLAYMLGTTHHETGRTMQPVRETFAQTTAKAINILESAWKAGRLPWVATPYWRLDANGKSWLGRGLVQLTHKSNYQRIGQKLGIDLVTEPDAAMNPAVAVQIMLRGMTDGVFTGKKLSDFFTPGKGDWRNARKIINQLERADLVATYARNYYAAISYTT